MAQSDNPRTPRRFGVERAAHLFLCFASTRARHLCELDKISAEDQESGRIEAAATKQRRREDCERTGRLWSVA